MRIFLFQVKQKQTDLTLLIPELESEYETSESTPPPTSRWSPTSTSRWSPTSNSNSEAARSHLPCRCCTWPQNSNSDQKNLTMSSSTRSSSLNWKLLVLLTIASAALASILVISHQVDTQCSVVARAIIIKSMDTNIIIVIVIIIMIKWISLQLISRHISTSERGVTLSLTIPESGWMSNQGFQIR